MYESSRKVYSDFHNKIKSCDFKNENMSFKIIDQRQTNDSTKEVGTSDFSHFISSIHKEELKGLQGQSENWMYRSFAVENNSPICERGHCETPMSTFQDEHNLSNITNISISGDMTNTGKRKKHKREISVTDIMPKTYRYPNPNETDENIEISSENGVTMRSLIFIQYFTVSELIRLKLVHSQLNNIINQECIEVAIQIGNFTDIERSLYWSSYSKYTLEMIYKLCPSSIIDLIKSSNNSTMFILKSSLK